MLGSSGSQGIQARATLGGQRQIGQKPNFPAALDFENYPVLSLLLKQGRLPHAPLLAHRLLQLLGGITGHAVIVICFLHPRMLGPLRALPVLLAFLQTLV